MRYTATGHRAARLAARLTITASGSAIAATLLLASPALAQDAVQAAADEGDEVTVTGFRRAIETAVATKRDSNQIVESVSAEDIGKLPDNSIAEAIARLPGLTAQRLDGRAQVISVRGLSPDFSSTLFNGREQVSTGDNRGVEFDQYPSELIGAVDVYKTPYAGLIGQGLSGTINLRSLRPLDYGRRTLSVNARGEIVSPGKLNSGTNDKGYRASLTYIDQFANDTVGITFGVAHINSPTQFERFNSWGYPTFDTNNDLYGIRNTQGTPGDTSDDTFTPRPEYAAAQGAQIIGGAKPYVQSTELERTTAMATLQWKPSSDFNILLDAYYSKFRDEHTLRGIEFPLYWGNAVLQPGYTVTDGVITDGTWGNVKGVIRNDANLREADLYSGGINIAYMAGGWKITGDASYSRVDREDKVLETYSGTSRGAGNGPYDTLGFSRGAEGRYSFKPTLNYADPTRIFLTSPQGWGADNTPGGQDGFLNNPNTTDELMAFRLDVERELGENQGKIAFGANYSKRDKTLDLQRWYLGLKANAADPLHNTSVAIPADQLLDPTELGFLGIPGMVSYDPLGLAYSGIYNFNPATDANVFAFGWGVREEIITGYARYDIDVEMSDGSRLGGNVGAQVVSVDQFSNGLAASGSPVATVKDVSDGVRYTYVLPNLNIVARLNGGFTVRFGAARQLARPRMDQMRAAINFSYDPSRAANTNINFSPWGGSGGNPRLRPWIANAVDLSVEKYFGRDSYVALAGFYKHLETYIFEQSQVYDFTGFPVTSGPAPALRQGIVTQWQNGSGGQLYGAELSATFSLRNLSEALDGFGVLGSVSYTESSITPNPNNPSQPLPGLSKWVANGTVYFEKWGFSARASVRHRSSFLAELSGIGTERIQRLAKAETIVDAQIGYEFQNGPLKGLGILAQAQNLTDEPFITHEAANESLTVDHQRYGVRYLLGLSYKL
ncbi:TonB-dependent receptor [Sphingomonas sp.]|uniref:TonB-dependent receptor n=1 Tax=Sphingomonas sp. TaxID=28214 RepID=UPI002ED806D5